MVGQEGSSVDGFQRSGLLRSSERRATTASDHGVGEMLPSDLIEEEGIVRSNLRWPIESGLESLTGCLAVSARSLRY